MAKTEILYGIHPVFEALKAGRRAVVEVYVAKGKVPKRFGKSVQLAESIDVPIKQVTPLELKIITGTDEHQGIGAKTGPFPFSQISDIEILGDLDEKNYFLLLLDNIIDPHNLGALIRTALCVGVDGVVVPKDRSALPTPAVSKASAGALEHVRLARVTNMTKAIKDLKKKGVWIAGLDPTSKETIFSKDLTGSVAIVVGGEEKGIRPLVKKHCDFLMSIPQIGSVNSLNASVAGAVAMYEVFRQRKKMNVRKRVKDSGKR